MGHNYSKTSSNSTLKGNTSTNTITANNKNSNQNTATNTINNNNCNTSSATTNTAATSVVTVEQPQTNRTPISPVINFQFEKSPTTSHTRLSTSSSSSLTSVNTICGKQIIIKIQLAKMENGSGSEQQQQHQVEQQQQQQHQVQAQRQLPAQAQDMPERLEMDANSNQLLNSLDRQILNVTLNRNFMYGVNDMSTADVVLRSPSSLSSSSTETMNRTAGSTASSMMMPARISYNNNNRNSCTATPTTTLHMERLNALQLNDELLEQSASDSVEYCELFESASGSRQRHTSTAPPPANDKEFVVCEGRDADNNNCCHFNKKTKSTSSSHSTTKTPLHRSSSKFPYREAIRRMLEPSSSKSNKNKERKENNNNNKQQKQQPQPHQQHSNNSSSVSALPSSEPCPYHQIQLQQQRQQQQHQYQEIQQSNSNNHLFLQYPPTTSSTNLAQATSTSAVGTAAGPRFSNNNNNSMSTNQQQLSIWSSNDVILPFNSPQVFVVCPSTSRVTLGCINDNAGIRFTTEIVGGDSVGNRGSGGGVVDTTTTVNSHLTQPNHHRRHLINSSSTAPNCGPIVHSQVDFVHCLVPDLERIINSSFYWGKMDRYEAERLLEGKPEGTFLLRDSAQEEFLFSVSFRKYGRSLHARIEQSGHRFSFDCHDPGVFTAPTVTGLLEHYKDPACVMFFEPMLTVPFHRKMVFSLQQLSRATIVSSSTYDGVNQLELPTRLKAYLKEYHYKQKLRVKPFDDTCCFSCT